MKAVGFISFAVGIVLMVTGCDAVRASLGKPTSKDIEALRQQKIQMQRTADSLALAIESTGIAGIEQDSVPELIPEPVPEAKPDTAITPESDLAPEPELPHEPERQEEPTATGLAEGFYAVVGSFKNESNAQYLYNSINASGTPVEIVKMKNGFTAVMICHGATYDDAYRGMME